MVTSVVREKGRPGLHTGEPMGTTATGGSLVTEVLAEGLLTAIGQQRGMVAGEYAAGAMAVAAGNAEVDTLSASLKVTVLFWRFVREATLCSSWIRSTSSSGAQRPSLYLHSGTPSSPATSLILRRPPSRSREKPPSSSGSTARDTCCTAGVRHEATQRLCASCTRCWRSRCWGAPAPSSPESPMGTSTEALDIRDGPCGALLPGSCSSESHRHASSFRSVAPSSW